MKHPTGNLRIMRRTCYVDGVLHHTVDVLQQEMSEAIGDFHPDRQILLGHHISWEDVPLVDERGQEIKRVYEVFSQKGRSRAKGS